MNLKYKKYLFVLAVLVLLSFLISIFSSKTPSLISSFPSNNANLDAFNSPITLEFNQKINPNNFTFTISPNETFSVNQWGPTKIILTLDKTFRINSKYILEISYKNKHLTQIAFTTNAPPNTQFDARFLENIQQDLNHNYPLMAVTPYQTANFRVVYTAPLQLTITPTNSQIPQDQILEQVKSWVSSRGVDAASHQYLFLSPFPNSK